MEPCLARALEELGDVFSAHRLGEHHVHAGVAAALVAVSVRRDGGDRHHAVVPHTRYTQVHYTYAVVPPALQMTAPWTKQRAPS